MSNSDSQVEVRVVGKLDGSVSTSAAAAKAEIAGIGQAAQQASAAVSQSYQQIINATTGVDAEVKSARESFLAFGEAIAEQKQLARTADDLENLGTAAGATHGAVSTATREFRALFDELSSGRTRMTPGTLAIIGQRVFGLSAASLIGVGAVAALAAGLGYLVVKSFEAAHALDTAQNAASFSGNNLSRQQLQADSAALDQFAGVSSKDAQQVIDSFTRMRDMSAPELDALARLVGEFAETQGQKAPEAAKIFIAALENEKLSAADLVKLLPGITQAQISNIETTQRMGNAHQTAAVLLGVMSDALGREKTAYAEQQSGMFASFKNMLEYIGVAQAGLSIEQAHTDILKHNTDAWEQNNKAILADLEALRKLASAPPPQDLVDPIQKTEAAIAHLDATWKGSTSARYTAEAQLWQQMTQQAGLGAKQVEQAQRNADEATFHAHEAAKTEQTKLDKTADEDALRGIEEQAVGAEKGSAEQIAAYENLYTTSVRLFGATSAQALSAEKELYTAKSAAAQQWLTELAAVETEAVATDNAAAQERAANIKREFQQKQITATQEIQQLQQTEDQRYQLTENSLNTMLVIWAGYPGELDRINKQIEANDREHQKVLGENARTGAEAITQEYKTAWAPVMNGFNSMVDGILSGNATLTQVLERGAVTMAENWVRSQLQQVEDTWISEQAKTSAVVAGNTARTGADAAGAAASGGISIGKYAAEIEADAAKTYADVFAWAAPELGPFAAVPAAAAAVLVGAQAALLPSFDVGTPYVTQNMVAQVHQGEMIIPSSFAAGLRSGDLTLGGEANDNGSGGGAPNFQFGDLHIYGVPNSNPQAFVRQIMNSMAQEIRNGNSTLAAAVRGP